MFNLFKPRQVRWALAALDARIERDDNLGILPELISTIIGTGSTLKSQK
jgi:hypothetical protein